MPESRLSRTRATLPEGYQYGEAGLLRRSDGIPFATADGRLIVNLPPSFQPLSVRMLALARRHQDTCSEGANCTLVKSLSATARDVAELEPPQESDAVRRWFETPTRWRAPHENAAAQLRRNQQRTGDEAV